MYQRDEAEVMARALPKEVTKVYLLNQDYLFGQSVQRTSRRSSQAQAGRARWSATS